ncbi:MAG: glycosyltransferase family 4 protein [Planctomycetota bacterium]
MKSGLAMVRNLEAMGHHVIVLAPGSETELVQDFKDAGAEFITISEIKNRLSLPTPFGARQILRIAKERSVDIIHAQDFCSIGSAYLAAILSNKAFVATEPGGPFKHRTPPRRTDAIVYSQEWVDALVGTYHFFQDNLHLIRARIDMDMYKPGRVDSAFIRQFGLPESGKKVVMAMRLVSGKKSWIGPIVETARVFSTRRKPIRLIVAGDGDLLPTLREEANQINKGSKNGPVLCFPGPIIGSGQITHLYNYADVAVGIGRGILEAMACRKPVVILGQNGQCELVTPDNVDDIAHFNFSGRHFRQHHHVRNSLAVLLENLLNDENKQNQLAEFSYEYVRTQMDARIGAKQTAEVYLKAFNKRPLLMDCTAWYIRFILNVSSKKLKTKLRLLHHSAKIPN